MSFNSKPKKYLIPVGILLVAIVIAVSILNNPPQANRRGPSKVPQMTVEAQRLSPQLYQIQVNSFGTVRPRTESVLVSQASGQIEYLSDNFRNGGFFEKGEVLLKLDNRDHLADVKIAQANLLDAKQKLAEEKARADQALNDWKRLGKKGQPNDLVLRKPQLEAAKARLLSSEAQLDKAELSLERTQIVAPYAGRVLQKRVDLGQVISNNSQLADIYAVDYVEIRLPIKNQDLALIDLPEEFRGQNNKANNKSLVNFSSSLGEHNWQGKLVRTEGAIDEQSQQLYVVAQIEDPYGLLQQNSSAIKIGQYVSAEIAGKIITDALVIPTQSIYQGTYVYVVEEGVLLRKDVELLWKNATSAIVKSGVSEGDQLVITALGQVSSGTPVSVAGETRMTSSQGDNKAQGQKRKLPPHLKEKFEKEAKERGISLQELMKEKRQQRMANGV